METQYNEMSLTELRALAKNIGIKSITALRKQELIDALTMHDKTTDTTVVDFPESDKPAENLVTEAKTVHSENSKKSSPVSIKEEPDSKTTNKKHTKPEAEVSTKKISEVEVKRNNKTTVKAMKTISAEETGSNKVTTGYQESEVKKPSINTQETENKKTPAMQQEAENKKIPDMQQEIENKKVSVTQQETEYKKASVIQQETEYKKAPYSQQESENKRVPYQQNLDNKSNYNSTMDTDARKAPIMQSDMETRKTPISSQEAEPLDSGETKEGILEVMPDGYGFIRCDNYLPGESDVYVSPAQIRRFALKTGDIVVGNTRIRNQGEKFSALLFVKSVNGMHPSEAQKRKKFEDLTPIFPNERIHLETPGANVSMRMVDLISPIGKGQRGMIVSQPKTGKTTLLKQIAKAITKNHPGISLIILLIDERPEEVTDIKESIEGKNVEVIYSTFDELPENHKRVSEMVIERAKRLVEHKRDVVILLDSITRLARAYNLTVQASGRTLSGGLDPAALHMPKRFFGAARNMREGGSLTILATALVDTGSRMDDVVFEEFKGTGNMELVLDRNLSEKRIFPAIDLTKSSTRRDDLLLSQSEMEATYLMRKAFNSMRSDDAVERIIDMFIKTKTNAEFIETIKKTKIVF